MAETITMPKLGFDMAEGTLVRWVRNEGENINKGDVLAEIETDKATVEVESSAGGVVRKLLVDQGAVVPIGAAIAIIGSADEKIDEPKAVGTQPSTKAGIAPQGPPKPAPVMHRLLLLCKLVPSKLRPWRRRWHAIRKLIYPIFKAPAPVGGSFAKILKIFCLLVQQAWQAVQVSQPINRQFKPLRPMRRWE